LIGVRILFIGDQVAVGRVSVKASFREPKLINRLPWTRDYDMDTFAEVARLTQKLGDAVSDALAAGRRRGGPRPFGELLQAVAWLREAAACFVYPYAQGEDRL
jgi:hypothetical protein